MRIRDEVSWLYFKTRACGVNFFFFYRAMGADNGCGYLRDRYFGFSISMQVYACLS